MKTFALLAAALLAAPALASAQGCETYDTDAGGFTVQTCPVPASFDRPATLECVLDGGEVFCWADGFQTPLQVRTCERIDGQVTCSQTDASQFVRLRDR